MLVGLLPHADKIRFANTGTEAADGSQVRLVRVQLVTGTEESTASYSASRQFSTSETLVRLRNQ